MLDPFTLATGLAGLLSLTIELTKIIDEYTGSVNNAPNEAQELFEELSALCHVLERLVPFLVSENGKSNSFGDTCVLFFASNACQNKLQSALRKLSKMREGSEWFQNVRRIKWPFDKQEYLDTINTVRRCMQTFEFSLTIEGW